MRAKSHPYMIVPRQRRTPTFDTSVRIGCPRCGAAALVRLPRALLQRQTDGTTHACLPTIGGCGWGASVNL